MFHAQSCLTVLPIRTQYPMMIFEIETRTVYFIFFIYCLYWLPVIHFFLIFVNIIFFFLSPFCSRATCYRYRLTFAQSNLVFIYYRKNYWSFRLTEVNLLSASLYRVVFYPPVWNSCNIKAPVCGPAVISYPDDKLKTVPTIYDASRLMATPAHSPESDNVYQKAYSVSIKFYFKTSIF